MQHITANGVVEAASLYIFMDCLMACTDREVWAQVPIYKAPCASSVVVFDTGRVLLVRRADKGGTMPILGFTKPEGVDVEVVRTKQWFSVQRPNHIVTNEYGETIACRKGRYGRDAVDSFSAVCRTSAKKTELKRKFAELKGKRTSRKALVKAWENRQQEKLENSKSYYRRTVNDGRTPWMKYIPSEIMAKLYAKTPELQNATTPKQAGRIWGRAIRRNRKELLDLMYGYDCSGRYSQEVWWAFNRFTTKGQLSDIFTFEGGENADE